MARMGPNSRFASPSREKTMVVEMLQVGVEKKIVTNDSLKELAAHYHSAFHQGIRCYPYFASQG